VQSACWISKVRIQTHTHNFKYLLTAVWSIL
jgi:hypothetical protein